MDLHDLEKAWSARAPHGPMLSAPTFIGERLMIGAQTEIAVRERLRPSRANATLA